MKSDPRQLDEMIRARLRAYTQAENDYWSFRTSAERNHMHACFQYPAMMVPQMQDALIGTIMEVVPSVRSAYEPFVGAGTAMIELMKRGLDFYGQDINPLAILLCRTKSGPFYEESLDCKVEELLISIKADRSVKLEADFPGLKKWFRDDVARELSKIRRAIRKEKYLWCRRFYWMALAEAVRLTSNSRTTTFKLHIRPKKEIRTRDVSPIKVFSTIVSRNVDSLSSQKKVLQESGKIVKGRYTGKVEIRLADSTVPTQSRKKAGLYDILVTSPPYGDNKTTVPYGQHSFLPLQWIDLWDIDDQIDEAWLETCYEIDNRSLGGRLRKATEDVSGLLDLSPSLKLTLQSLRHEPRDRKLRVAAFWRDFNRCVEPILASLKPNAYMIWTVGNRRVAGRAVPMDRILLELVSARGAELVDRLPRTIPSKRMAVKNNVSTTMRSETILVMRKKAAR